jgi:hypothetical protein
LTKNVTTGVIWSAGGYTFTTDLGATLTGGPGLNDTFSLGVKGTVDDGAGPGDPTPAFFTFTTTPTVGGQGAFAAISVSTEATRVPDSGTTCVLLGAGLVALGARKRLMS